MCGSKIRLDAEDIHVYPHRTEAIGWSDHHGISDALMSLSDLPTRGNYVCRSVHNRRRRRASRPSSGGNSQVERLPNHLCPTGPWVLRYTRCEFVSTGWVLSLSEEGKKIKKPQREKTPPWENLRLRSGHTWSSTCLTLKVVLGWLLTMLRKTPLFILLLHGLWLGLVLSPRNVRVGIVGILSWWPTLSTSRTRCLWSWISVSTTIVSQVALTLIWMDTYITLMI